MGCCDASVGVLLLLLEALCDMLCDVRGDAVRCTMRCAVDNVL